MWQGDETRALALARAALDIAAAVRARNGEILAWNALGDAELALGRCAAARHAYSQASARALEVDDAGQHDTSAGLARVALAEGDTAAAMTAVQSVLARVAAGGTLGDTQDTRLVELTCHQVLARAGDPRAADWLARAHTALMAQAEAIPDAALRQGLLQNIPHHREIVAAWAQRGAGAEGAASTAD